MLLQSLLRNISAMDLCLCNVGCGRPLRRLAHESGKLRHNSDRSKPSSCVWTAVQHKAVPAKRRRILLEDDASPGRSALPNARYKAARQERSRSSPQGPVGPQILRSPNSLPGTSQSGVARSQKIHSPRRRSDNPKKSAYRQGQRYRSADLDDRIRMHCFQTSGDCRHAPPAHATSATYVRFRPLLSRAPAEPGPAMHRTEPSVTISPAAAPCRASANLWQKMYAAPL